jgi:hypothetical protein
LSVPVAPAARLCCIMAATVCFSRFPLTFGLRQALMHASTLVERCPHVGQCHIMDNRTLKIHVIAQHVDATLVGTPHGFPHLQFDYITALLGSGFYNFVGLELNCYKCTYTGKMGG